MDWIRRNRVYPKADVDALPDYVHEDVALPANAPSHGGMAWLREHLLKMPEVMRYTAKVEETVAEGDKVAARIAFRGKLVSEYMGLQPNGNEFEIETYMIVTFRDGKISRFRILADDLSMVEFLFPMLG